MTEGEWLTSESPQDMLNHLADLGKASLSELSAWVQACRAVMVFVAGEPTIHHVGLTPANISVAIGAWCMDLHSPAPSRAVRAALLREIIDDPLRPAACILCNDAGTRRVHPGSPSRGIGSWPCDCRPWLTPAVRLATEAAHDQGRWGDLPVIADMMEEAGCTDERCPTCRGTGKLSCSKCSGEGCSPHALATNGRCTAGDPCLACGQAGRLPNRLLMHLRGKQRRACHRCGGDGRAHGADRPFEWSPDPDRQKCPICKGSGLGIGWRDSELLGLMEGREPCWGCTRAYAKYMSTLGCTVCGDRRWIASRGPHILGCWAIRTMLGDRRVTL